MVFEVSQGSPPKTRAVGRPRIYPYGTMEVGTQFTVPLNGEPERVVLQRVRGAYRWHLPKKFTCAVVGDGVVVGRVA